MILFDVHSVMLLSSTPTKQVESQIWFSVEEACPSLASLHHLLPYILLHSLSLSVLRSGQVGIAFYFHSHTSVMCFDVWESEDKRRKELV